MNINESPSSKSSPFWDQNELRLLSVWSKTAEVSPEFKENLSPEDLLEQVKAEIRQNHQFTLFCVLPSIAPQIREVRRMGHRLNISDDRAWYFSAQLLRTGLWTLDGDEIRTHFDYLDLGDISVKDYLAFTVGMISQISEDKGHFYETLSTVTNRNLIRNFKAKVNQALRELHESSLTAEEKDCLFSWTHTGLIELEMKNLKKKDDHI